MDYIKQLTLEGDPAKRTNRYIYSGEQNFRFNFLETLLGDGVDEYIVESMAIKFNHQTNKVYIYGYEKTLIFSFQEFFRIYRLFKQSNEGSHLNVTFINIFLLPRFNSVLNGIDLEEYRVFTTAEYKNMSTVEFKRESQWGYPTKTSFNSELIAKLLDSEI